MTKPMDVSRRTFLGLLGGSIVAAYVPEWTAAETAGSRLIVPAVMAALVAYALHRRQEARFADVGPNTVTRPLPELPF